MPVSGSTNGRLMLRELEDLRRRDRAQRDELARRERLTQRLAQYGARLRSFLRDEAQGLDVKRTLAEIARLSGLALEVERVSIWLFDDARERLNCTVLLLDGKEQLREGLSADAGEFPVYFRALLEGECLAVEDARNDDLTREFAPYLTGYDVHALIDVPILTAGGIIGVLRYGNTGSQRAWCGAEIDFAAAVGARIALELEAARRATAERAANDTAAKYRHLVESLPVTVYSFDLRTNRFEYLSPRIYELGGWTAEEWLKEGSLEQWIERVHPDDRATVWSAVRARRQEPDEIVYRVRVDGRIRWVRDRHSIVRDHAGVPIFVQGVLADVTKWKESEIYGLELERRFHTLLENVDMLAVILDTQGRLEFANDRFVQMSGRDQSRLMGSDFFESMIVDGERDETAAHYREAMLAGSISPHVESTLLNAQGEERRVLWTNQILRNADGSIRGTACLGLDLTDRLRLRHELLEQSKLDSLGRLAAGIAHDFNNLLTVMMNEVEFFSAHASAENLRALREVVQPALRQAADMTRALLTYARQQPTSPAPVTIDAMLEEETGLLRAIAGKNIHFAIDKDAGSATVLIDPSLLRQVVFNLVNNAADATRGQDRHIAIKTSVDYVDDVTARKHGAAEGGSYVTVSVTDDGQGMDAGTASRIFEPFFSTKPRGQGTGLGLSISHGIVRKAGGFITVESELGQGSTFRAYFPLAPTPESVVPEPRQATTRPSAVQAPRAVLFVQQRGDARRDAVEWLASAGYRVFTATDTKSASDVLSDLRVDVLIADATLPDGLGAVLLRSARAVHSGVRTLLICSAGQDAEGIDAVLVRPFDSQQLVDAVEHLAPTSSSRSA